MIPPEDIVKRALLLAILSLAPFSSSLLAAGIPVGGRVLGPDGKPFPNARVALVPYLSIAEIGKLESPENPPPSRWPPPRPAPTEPSC